MLYTTKRTAEIRKQPKANNMKGIRVVKDNVLALGETVAIGNRFEAFMTPINGKTIKRIPTRSQKRAKPAMMLADSGFLYGKMISFC